MNTLIGFSVGLLVGAALGVLACAAFGRREDRGLMPWWLGAEV